MKSSSSVNEQRRGDTNRRHHAQRSVWSSDINLEVTERFKDRLIQEGYSPSYGARPLCWAIMCLLEDSLAEEILSGRIKDGDTVIVDVDENGNVQVSSQPQRELLPQGVE